MRLNDLFSVPLGMGSVYSPMRKEWIESAISGAVGLGTSLLGGAASAHARRLAEKRSDAVYNREYARELRDYNENPTDRADNQALLTRVEKFNMKNWRRAQGAKAVGAGTDAAAQMQKDAGNELMASTISNMAAQNAARKDRATERMNQTDQAYANRQMAFDNQRAQEIASAAGAASNAIMSVGSAFDSQGTRNADLNGASNNGEVKSTPSDTGVKDNTITSPNAAVKFASDTTGTPKDDEWRNFRNAVSQ